MLYALRHPLALTALLLGFALGITVRGVVQAQLAARLGDRGDVLAGRGRPDPRRHIEAFGAVAAAIAGVGWGRPTERPSYVRSGQRGRLLAVLLAGPAAVLLLGVVLLVGYRAAGGPPAVSSVGLTNTVHGAYTLDNPGQTLLLFMGVELVAMAALALVPMPPLDGGRILFLYAPKTPGWQKAEYHLAEQNIGTAIVLALLIIPLAAQTPLLLFIIDTLLQPLFGLAAV